MYASISFSSQTNQTNYKIRNQIAKEEEEEGDGGKGN
jgi:hypothetical protein